MESGPPPNKRRMDMPPDDGFVQNYVTYQEYNALRLDHEQLKKQLENVKSSVAEEMQKSIFAELDLVKKENKQLREEINQLRRLIQQPNGDICAFENKTNCEATNGKNFDVKVDSSSEGNHPPVPSTEVLSYMRNLVCYYNNTSPQCISSLPSLSQQPQQKQLPQKQLQQLVPQKQQQQLVPQKQQQQMPQKQQQPLPQQQQLPQQQPQYRHQLQNQQQQQLQQQQHQNLQIHQHLQHQQQQNFLPTIDAVPALFPASASSIPSASNAGSRSELKAVLSPGKLVQVRTIDEVVNWDQQQAGISPLKPTPSEESPYAQREQLLPQYNLWVSRSKLHGYLREAESQGEQAPAFVLRRVMMLVFTIEEMAHSRGQGIMQKSTDSPELMQREPLDPVKVQACKEYMRKWCLERGRVEPTDKVVNTVITHQITYARTKLKRMATKLTRGTGGSPGGMPAMLAGFDAGQYFGREGEDGEESSNSNGGQGALGYNVKEECTMDQEV